MPITMLIVSKSFDALFMETGKKQAIIHVRMETTCLNVCRAPQ